jgi:hypothetical protein
MGIGDAFLTDSFQLVSDLLLLQVWYTFCLHGIKGFNLEIVGLYLLEFGANELTLQSLQLAGCLAHKQEYIFL